MGVPYEVVVADAEKYHPVAKLMPRSYEDCSNQLDREIETPPGFTIGSMKGNFRYDEMLAELQKMHTQYPHLISAFEPIGNFTTHENRPIYHVSITNFAKTTSPRNEVPKILYTALHHAKEPVSMTQLIFLHVVHPRQS